MYLTVRIAHFPSDVKRSGFESIEDALAQAEHYKANGSARVLVLEPAEGGHEIAAIV